MLLDIPEEVIEGHLLPFLKWNDLLRFRRVCKVTKAITNGYMRVHPELAPEIEINEKGRSFGAFLEMGIPIKKIYLKNPSADLFYEKDEDDIDEFLERYGGIITSLRVDKLSLFLYPKEKIFLMTLVNLQELEAGHFTYGVVQSDFASDLWNDDWISELVDQWFDGLEEDENEKEEDCVPQVIKQLKVLKIGQEPLIWDTMRETIDRTGLMYLCDNVTTMDHISLPFTSHPVPLPEGMAADQRDPKYRMNFTLFRFLNEIDRRALSHPELVKAKVIDFSSCHDPTIEPIVHLTATDIFPDLLTTCVTRDIKLMNVSSLWCVSRIYIPQPDPKWRAAPLGVPILSLVDLHPCVLSLDMPNLEAIRITATSSSSVGQYWRAWRDKGGEWPALKYLSVTVDSKISEHFVHPNAELLLSDDTRNLFRFFFQDVVRPELTELCFQFTKDSGDVAVPNAKEIVGACPNLKKLTLVNWPGTNKALLELFGGLSELEEVTFEGCKNLGNVSFVGLDTSQPVFFKLSKLRKLSLKGLDQMPKITDLLFTMVVRHLKLTHLALTSDFPIKSVTEKGIRALLEGEFSQSIEKFPFQDWSLDGVSAEEFAQLEKQFRAYNML